MLLKILKKDIKRNKIITATLFMFITLAIMLVVSATSIIMELAGSMDNLFQQTNVPHLVQMHTGEINRQEIIDYATTQEDIESYQIVEMLNVDGTSLTIGNQTTTEEKSVMDVSFVTQNQQFDFLINLDNERVAVSEGYVAVPIYYFQQYNLQKGDPITIKIGTLEKNFIISDFIRDVQMNPSLINSKRFLLHPADFEELKAQQVQKEYLIEFQLTDLQKVANVTTAYQATALPQKGPLLDHSLIQTLNILTEGIVVAVIMLVSLLLILIAALCLRFTLIGTIEEDYREIGVMKALGIRNVDIKKIYITKYIAISTVALVAGYLLSLLVNQFLTANITLYMGSVPKTLSHYLIPLLAAVLIFLIIILYCWFVIRKLQKISAVEALRTGSANRVNGLTRKISLSKTKRMDTNIFLGIKDVIIRFKSFSTLCLVFVIAAFIITIPVNFLNTMSDTSFITYMGAGRSDIRVDMIQSENVNQRFQEISSILENDEEIAKFATLATSSYKVLGTDGNFENINIEVGDFTVFPIEYLNGQSPELETEIALSYLNAQELEKTVGDTIQILIGEETKDLVVSGIYQDITNAGKTAKAKLPVREETILWYIINIDVQPGVNVQEKIKKLEPMMAPAKITDIDNYLDQTLGSTIDQLALVTNLAIGIAVIITILITALFLKMTIAKDRFDIAIMKSLGFTKKNLQLQYIIRSLLVLIIGLIIGTITANTLGQSLVNMIGASRGAADITFVINPWIAYLGLPLVLITSVTITTLMSVSSIKKITIFESSQD